MTMRSNTTDYSHPSYIWTSNLEPEVSNDPYLRTYYDPSMPLDLLISDRFHPELIEVE